jgi:hypothetical protein
MGLLATAASGSSDEAVLRAAEEAFHAGVAAAGQPSELESFHRSAELYEDLRQRGHRSPAFFQNQGNAYFLAEDLPEAILAYRRGLGLAPDDVGLRNALAEARGHVLYPGSNGFARPPAEHWPPFLPHPSLGLLLTITVLAYLGVCMAVTRWYMQRRRRLVFALFMLGMTAALTTATVLELHARREAVEHPLVLIARDNVVLRKGNGASYPKRAEYPLNRGVEARLRSERAGWLQIELGSGEVGWVPAKTALVDRD